MAIAKIAHHPEMTREQTMEVFKKEFGDRYKVYSLKGTLVRPRHFAMRKSGLRGVSLRLVQTKDETKLYLYGLHSQPSAPTACRAFDRLFL